MTQIKWNNPHGKSPFAPLPVLPLLLFVIWLTRSFHIQTTSPTRSATSRT